jgi:hypothetical protein
VIRFLWFPAMMALLAVSAVAGPDEWKAEGWNRTDFSRTIVEWSEVLSGGPPKDGIPAIDEPHFKQVTESTGLQATDPIISVEINDDARAYPLKILIWHEIVNDTVGGTPVTVTFCPLCNASIVFDRRVGGTVLDFGTTGKLRHSDLIMYDRQTESWWQQFTGKGIVGVHAGKDLKILPARIEAFSEFAARHPLGKVLVPIDPSFRDYGRNPYEGYDTSVSPFLYRGDMPTGIDPMARVVVIRRENAAPLIVALDLVRRRKTFDHSGYRLSWKAGQSSALDAAEISKGRDVGTIAVIEKVTGKTAAYDVVFAFAAHAFHPEIQILRE